MSEDKRGTELEGDDEGDVCGYVRDGRRSLRWFVTRDV